MKGGFYRKNTQNENLGYSFSALFRVDNNDGYREKFPSSIRFLFTSGGEIIDVSRLFSRFRIKWSVKSQDDENDFVKDVMGRSPNRNLLLSSHRVFLPFSLFFPSKAILKFSLIAFDLFSPRNFLVSCFRSTQGRQLRWWQIDHCYWQPNSRHSTASL